MKKFTKIIATIGPATDSKEKVRKMIQEGVDVFRFNFKHNTIDWHDKTVQLVTKSALELNTSVGTLIDIRDSIDRDLEALRIASRNEIDFVALSYIKSAHAIKKLRKQMSKFNVKAKVIAKIETKESLDNLKEIIKAADGIMVARGDLSKALPMEEVPYYQKIIIKESIKHTKPVITATEMLQSMVINPYPTRAEVSDVANAVYDLTDAVMLSAETALGKYSAESVSHMVKTVAFNEKKNLVDSRLRFNFELNDDQELLANAAYGLYIDSRSIHREISGFLVFTKTGRTARLLSRYRPLVPIYAFLPTKRECDSLSVSYGVYSILEDVPKKSGELVKKYISQAVSTLHHKKLIAKGQSLITILGDYWGRAGEISTIKLVRV